MVVVGLAVDVPVVDATAVVVEVVVGAAVVVLGAVVVVAVVVVTAVGVLGTPDGRKSMTPVIHKIPANIRTIITPAAACQIGCCEINLASQPGCLDP